MILELRMRSLHERAKREAMYWAHYELCKTCGAPAGKPCWNLHSMRSSHQALTTRQASHSGRLRDDTPQEWR